MEISITSLSIEYLRVCHTVYEFKNLAKESLSLKLWKLRSRNYPSLNVTPSRRRRRKEEIKEEEILRFIVRDFNSWPIVLPHPVGSNQSNFRQCLKYEINPQTSSSIILPSISITVGKVVHFCSLFFSIFITKQAIFHKMWSQSASNSKKHIVNRWADSSSSRNPIEVKLPKSTK